MNRFYLLLLTILFVGSYQVFAQVPDESSLPGMDTSGSFSLSKLAQDAIKISGDIGSNGELYSVSGKKSQRPGSSGRLFLRPSISLFDKVTINFDLFLSSEGSGARQDINTMKFSPEWSWGRLYYGDYSLQLSKFTLTDVNINGYGIELFPSIFKFSAVSGKTQKAITGDASAAMYDRTLYGGKIGLGDEGGTHFHINFVRAYDDKNSLPRSLFTQIDTVSIDGGTRIDTNYTGVTPSENLIAGTNWGIGLFGNAFKFRGEAAVSLFTKDLYSRSVENKDIPAEVGQYFTPRLTTSGDIAYEGEMSLNTRFFNAKGGYTMVGPGYTSLGMGSLINDREIIKAGMGLNLFGGDFNINGTFQRQSDNVADQKTFTTERNNFGVSVSVRPVKSLFLTFMTNVNEIANNAPNDSLRIENTSASMAVTGTLMFAAFGVQNSFNTGVSTQNSEVKSVLRGNLKVTSSNMQFGLNTLVNKQLSTNIVVVVSSVDLGPQGTSSTNTITGKANYKLFNDKLNTGLNYTRVSASTTNSNVLGFQAGYQVFEGSTISLNTRATFFKGKGTNPLKFNEYVTTFDWSYRF